MDTTDATGDAPLADIESERRRLLALAYRMTGTLADAEDVVQETYLRWYRLEAHDRDAIANPAGWLTTVASRVALDLLGSARRRRERYIGQWLPEPVPADLFAGTAPVGMPLTASVTPDPLDRVTLDDAVSTALLLVLESMTPAERVAFVLHDVFGYTFEEIATIVGRSAAAVRQLGSAARRHVREGRTSPVPPHQHAETVRAFGAAAQTGDLAALMALLAPGVELRSDGGGVVSAAPRVVTGPDHVARFLLGIRAKQPLLEFEEAVTADGLGYRIRLGGRVFGMVGFHVEDGLVTDVWLMLNPAKLTSWLDLPDRF